MCIAAKACGAVRPVGKNDPVALEAGGKTYAWDGMVICGVWVWVCGEYEEDRVIKIEDWSLPEGPLIEYVCVRVWVWA